MESNIKTLIHIANHYGTPVAVAAEQFGIGDPVDRESIRGRDIDAAWDAFQRGLTHNVIGYGETQMALKMALECVYSAGKQAAFKENAGCENEHAYKVFLQTYLGEHCPTAKEQRVEIDIALKELADRDDFLALDVVRGLLKALCVDNYRSHEIFFVLKDLLEADDKGIHLVGVFLRSYLEARVNDSGKRNYQREKSDPGKRHHSG